MAISMLKIRRPLGRLIFNMGIAIPGKTVFLIETAPCLQIWTRTQSLFIVSCFVSLVVDTGKSLYLSLTAPRSFPREFIALPSQSLCGFLIFCNPLQWHNWHDDVSNHQPHHCLLSHFFGRRSTKTSKDPHHWPLPRCGEFTGYRTNGQ